jgi:hypothetical protein
MADSRCGPCSGRRARHQLADTEGEFVVVMIIQKGATTISRRHTAATLTPGDVAAWDSTQRNQFTVPESLSKRSMLIPRAALDEVGGRSWMRDGVVLDPTAPATRLLTTHLHTLSEVLPELGSAAMSAARMAALELFVGALRTDSDVCSAESVRPALRASMERYIEQNLLNGAVTPAAIAAAHWVSIRTVNRVFSATATPATSAAPSRPTTAVHRRTTATPIAATPGFLTQRYTDLARGFKPRLLSRCRRAVVALSPRSKARPRLHIRVASGSAGAAARATVGAARLAAEERPLRQNVRVRKRVVELDIAGGLALG